MADTPSFLAILIEHFWQAGMTFVMVMTMALALAVYHYQPTDRRSLYNTLVVFAATLAGLALAATFSASGIHAAADSVRALFILLMGMAIIRLWGLFLFRVLVPALRFSPPHILEDITVSVAYIAWAMVRLRYAGLDLGSLLTTSAVITAVLAFSLQDTLGNILGGVALQLDDSVSVGDWIKVDDVTGKVVDIRWRFTAIETRNWETVVLPNGQLMKGKFTVLGKRDGNAVPWRRWVWFNVDFSVPPARVIESVETAVRAANINHVARTPAPNCLLMDFDAGFGRYAVRYWLTDLLHDDPTDSSIRANIYAALQRAEIKLAVPRYDLHTTKIGERFTESMRAEEMARRHAVVKRIELFRHLTEDERNTICERLDYVPFAKGEIITQQGSIANWLYILSSGEADVLIDVPKQPPKVVSTLSGGNIFGEMGLMTGSPRTATVIAKTDVECYQLDKQSFQDIIESRPAIAEEIAQELAKRKTALDTAQMEVKSTKAYASTRADDILVRIQNFFGLGNN